MAFWAWCCCKCFKLVRCDDVTQVLYSTDDLSSYENHTVKINGDATHTWKVYKHTPQSDCSNPTDVTVDSDESSTPCLCYELTEC